MTFEHLRFIAFFCYMSHGGIFERNHSLTLRLQKSVYNHKKNIDYFYSKRKQKFRDDSVFMRQYYPLRRLHSISGLPPTTTVGRMDYTNRRFFPAPLCNVGDVISFSGETNL